MTDNLTVLKTNGFYALVKHFGKSCKDCFFVKPDKKTCQLPKKPDTMCGSNQRYWIKKKD